MALGKGSVNGILKKKKFADHLFFGTVVANRLLWEIHIKRFLFWCKSFSKSMWLFHKHSSKFRRFLIASLFLCKLEKPVLRSVAHQKYPGACGALSACVSTAHNTCSKGYF